MLKNNFFNIFQPKLQKSEIIYLSIILLLFFCYSLFKILNFPINIDEAITYNNFTSKNIFTSATYYPEPNNHILFSIITNIFNYLPFDSKINIRLPNLIIGVICSLSVYLILRKIFNFKVAVIPHTVFTFSYIVGLYSILARGYMFYIFFTCICFYCVYKICENNRKIYWKIFTISSILAFYTIPSFLYVSVSFFIYLIFIFAKNTKALLQLFKYYIVIGILVLLLYLPVIYYNGFESITNNNWTKSIAFIEILKYIKSGIYGFYNVLLGVRSDFIFILFFILLILIAIKTSDKKIYKLIIFVFLFFLLPFVYILIHSVIPQVRIWSYLIFPFVLGIAIILNFILEKINIKLIYIYLICGFSILFQIYVFNKTHPFAVNTGDIKSDKMASLVMNNNYHNFYFHNINTAYEEQIIKYNYLSKNVFYYSKKDFDKNQNLNIDTTNLKLYDCIILYQDNKFCSNELKNYKLIYDYNNILIYGRK